MKDAFAKGESVQQSKAKKIEIKVRQEKIKCEHKILKKIKKTQKMIAVCKEVRMNLNAHDSVEKVI